MKDMFTFIMVCLVIFIQQSFAQTPFFTTTISNKFETGSVVLDKSAASSNATFQWATTPIVYLNSYTTTPSFCYGLNAIETYTFQGTAKTQAIIDVTIISSSMTQTILQFNVSKSTVTPITLIRVNYMASTQSFDIRTHYQNYLNQQTMNSNRNYIRITTFSPPYNEKGNSSNTVLIYNTVGVSMIRQSNTFDFSLEIDGYSTFLFTLKLTLQANNGMRFLRISYINYERIMVKFNPPFYIDMGFTTTFTGTIPNTSPFSLAITGTAFMGLTDWAIKDLNQRINNTIDLSGLSYTIRNDANQLTRVRASYMWYRYWSCQERYYNQSNVCSSCHFSCLTCSGNTNANCLSCSASDFRTFSSNKCPCMNGYLQINSQVCQQLICPTHICTSCSSNNICLTCIPFRVVFNTTCVCQDYYFAPYEPSLYNCIPCNPSCLSCQNSMSQCKSCSGTRDFRVLNAITKTCVCIDKYYQNPSFTANIVPFLGKGSPCIRCHYSCATCALSNSCSTCSTAKGRSYNSASLLCSCNATAYDDGSQECKTCPYNCLTCSSATVCTSCSASRENTDSNKRCPCRSGYFDTNTSLAQCQRCNIACFTCTNSNSCSSCSSAMFRSIINQSSCICIDRYYQIGQANCAPCDQTCLNCESLSTKCTSCNSLLFRELTVDFRCICSIGYYSGLTGLCQPCYFTCQSCNSDTSSSCLTCNATLNRVKINSSCLCMDKYFEKNTLSCQACSYFCLTCTSATICSTCDNTTRDISNLTNCRCLTGFYDDGISSSCLRCRTQCSTCTNGNNCTTCGLDRIFSTIGTCICNITKFQPYCESCSYECYQCSGSRTYCIQCKAVALRYLNQTSNKCLCLQGYYDDGVNQTCARCDLSCKSCLNGVSCETCTTNRIKNNSLCVCDSLFFQDSLNLNCLPCHYSCKTCSSYSVCTSCQSTRNRITSNNSALCVCVNGYYDYGIQQCAICSYKCLTCSANSVCTSCNDTANYIFSNNDCLCKVGYYLDAYTLQCTSCHNSCHSCTSSLSCMVCKVNRQLSGSLCTCVDGYYENTTSLQCLLCSFPCVKCNLNSANCISCNNTVRLLSDNTCKCIGANYDTGINCAPCLNTCQTCNNGTACLTCLDNSLRTRNTQGLCICLAKYHDENGTQLICSLCHYSCKTCRNSVSCDSCNPVRVTSSGYCLCPERYYDDGSNQNCISCSISCLTCSNLPTNCTSCLIQRTLSANKCNCPIKFYDNGISLNCQACNYKCQSCLNGATCFSCNSTKFRFISETTCACLLGYYDDGSNELCAACPYSCKNCTSSSFCLSCSSTRILTGSACLCIDLYYDGGNETCLPCNYQCATCSNNTQCSTCPSTRTATTINSLVNCICNNKFYDVPNVLECSNCSQQCQNCIGIQICTSCKSNSNRILVQNRCVCISGYYYNYTTQTDYICQLCHHSCQTCSFLNQCQTCNSNFKRIFNSTSRICDCASGYYDNGTSQCIICPFDCLTCQSSDVCLSCSSQRILINSRCQCNNSYYLDGTLCQSCPIECNNCSNYSYCYSCKINRMISLVNGCDCVDKLYSVSGTASCLSCHYTCLTCVNPTQCRTCNDTANRQLKQTSCNCKLGFYDQGIQNCGTCLLSCLSCKNGTNCQTCSLTKNRIYNPNTELCDCIASFYQDSSTKLCTPCNAKCLTCSNGSACTSCNTNDIFRRTLNLTTFACDCPAIGYFDILPQCSLCYYACFTCSNANTFCTSCQNSTFNTNRWLSGSSCLCQQGFFDQNNNQICSPCSYRCVTCSIDSLNCTLCSTSNHRNTIPNCLCQIGYFDDGFNSTCQICDYKCLTCTNQINCVTCDLNISKRVLNNFTNLCDCIVSYYDTGNNNICQPCLYSCVTCQHPSRCLTCSVITRQLYNSQCVCKSKYFDDGSSLECIACNYTCKSCISLNQCDSCNSNLKRIYNSTSYKCDCMTGYYDVTIQACSTCHASCYTCQSATACTSCPSNINKTLNASSGSLFCVCLFGYYEISLSTAQQAILGYNSQCKKCYYTCQTCQTTQYTCTACTPTSNRNLTALSQCQCLVGFYNIFNIHNCQPCNVDCLTCNGGNSNNCLTCSNTKYILNGICYSTCPNNYKNTQTPLKTCLPCTANCLSCVSSVNICNQCQSTHFIFNVNSNSSICITSCPNIYYEVNKTCYACLSPCVTCTAIFSCLTCINHFYLHSSNACFPCHSLCSTCNGSTALDCITCTQNYILSGSVCRRLSCLSTQFVLPGFGCSQCSVNFPNSLTCLSTGATSCKDGFLLYNSTCRTCGSVPGYILEPTTGRCKDLCGDGIIITDLCDDGNTLNGDGCSSLCKIQQFWTCPSNLCVLSIIPNIAVQSIKSIPLQNTIVLILTLNVRLRLIKENFILKFKALTDFTYSVEALNIFYDRYQMKILYRQNAQNEQLNIQVKSPITNRRLLAATSINLNINLNLNINVNIDTNPPAVYITTEQLDAYSKYIFALLGILHVLLLIAIVITLLMKLKVMLLIIDALNSMTILYILGALGLYNVTLLGFSSSKALQPFVHPFGNLLRDSSTNMYYLNYTENYFSSSIIQFLIICIVSGLAFYNQFFKPKDKVELVQNKENVWHYFRTSFIFAFSYDLFLTCFSIFFWSQFTSMQSSFSWMFSVLTLILITAETLMYYKNGLLHYIGKNRVLPSNSLNTIALDNKQKTKNQIDIIQVDDSGNSKKKIKKSMISQNSEENTQQGAIELGQIQKRQIQSFDYYDLIPSVQTQYTMPHSNHIKAIHLPILSIIFGMLFAIVINIQIIKIRSVLLFTITILYFIFVIATKNQNFKSIRSLKLLLFSIIYILISLITLITAFKSQPTTILNFDHVIISLVVLCVILNIIMFIVNVYNSKAYRDYLIEKKNQQILERNKKQLQTREKIYTKQKQKQKKKFMKINDTNITNLHQPESFQSHNRPEIQVSQEPPMQEKYLKISSLKKMKNSGLQSNQIGEQIDRQFSDMSQFKQEFYKKESMEDNHNIFDPRIPSRDIDYNTPNHHNRLGSRIKSINNSQMEIQYGKRETPSAFFDNTLERIEEIKGKKKKTDKSKEKEEIQEVKKVTKKKKKKNVKKANYEIDIADSSQEQNYQNLKVSQNYQNIISKKLEQQKKSSSILDALEEFDMPKGFNINKHADTEEHFRARINSIDEISSIKQERQQYYEQGLLSQEAQGGLSVFNKILQQYKKYKYKKVDKKKLKQIQKKMKDGL